MSALVSVVVPTWNGERFVRATLDSVLAQTWPAVELIVCDDGSTDGTRALVAGYGARLRLLEQENQGVSAARNRGAQAARGTYLAFLDHDDVWEPELLARLVPVLEAHPAVGVVYADSWVIDAAGAVRGRRSQSLRSAEGRVFEALLRANFVPVETTLLRADLFRAAGGFDPSLRYLEDWELCLRLARRTEFARVDAPLARYRVHDRNLSHDVEAMLVEWCAILERLTGADGGLSAAERALATASLARARADVAWRALRRRDLDAAGAWLARAGGAAPFALRARIRALALCLRVLPRAAGDALLARLPERRLYGVAQERARDGA